MTDPNEQPECGNCDSQGWVCENHMNQPWGGVSDALNACECGAGAPCPKCNLSEGLHDPPRPAPGTTVLWTAKDGIAH